MAFTIPASTPVPTNDIAIFIELDRVFLCLWVRSVTYQCDSFIYFEYRRVQRRRPPYVQVENLWAGLIADEEQILETFGNE